MVGVYRIKFIVLFSSIVAGLASVGVLCKYLFLNSSIVNVVYIYLVVVTACVCLMFARL